MQQKLPCDLCGSVPFTTSIVAYHRWTVNEQRYGWKQRCCFKCANREHGKWQKLARTEANDGEDWPTTCPACGSRPDPELELTRSTWYRGKNRRDTVLPLCWQCTTAYRAVCQSNAEELEDRPLDGSGRGAPPSLNSATQAMKDDLPW